MYRLRTLLACSLPCLPAFGQCERFIQEVPSPWNPTSVAYAGQRTVVGYPMYNQPGSNTVGGSVRVIKDEGGTITPHGWIFSPSTTPELGDEFGWRVDAEGPELVVSAQFENTDAENGGGVYAFTKQPGGWMFTQRLAPPVPVVNARYGFDLDLDGDTLVVGSIADNGVVANTGAAYVYRKIGASWQLEATLNAPDGGDDDRFGWSVALSGDTLMVSATRADGTLPDLGAVYVYERTGSTWTQVDKLFEPEVLNLSNYGLDITLDGDLAAVGGAYWPGTTEPHGAVWVYRRGPQGWAREQRIQPEDTSFNSNYGAAVALGGERLFIGRSWQNDGHTLEQWQPYAGSWVRTSEIGSPQTAPGPYIPRAIAVQGDQVTIIHYAGGPLMGAVVIDLYCGLGEVFCAPNAANSTGSSGALAASGSLAAADNSLTLSASLLPPGQFALGLVGTFAGSAVIPGRPLRPCAWRAPWRASTARSAWWTRSATSSSARI